MFVLPIKPILITHLLILLDYLYLANNHYQNERIKKILEKYSNSRFEVGNLIHKVLYELPRNFFSD